MLLRFHLRSGDVVRIDDVLLRVRVTFRPDASVKSHIDGASELGALPTQFFEAGTQAGSPPRSGPAPASLETESTYHLGKLHHIGQL